MDLTTLINAVVALLSAVLGVVLTLWVQSQKERIKLLSDGTLYVDCRAIKKDGNGFFIPGHGRLQVPEDMKEEFLSAIKGKKNIAFLCVNRTPGSSYMPSYDIHRYVPL